MYMEFAQIPQITNATIVGILDEIINVQVLTTVKDFKQLQKKRMTTNLVVMEGNVISSSFASEASSESECSTYSPSRKLVAHFKQITQKDGSKKRFVEVWSHQSILHSIEVTDKHGEFCSDDTFGGYFAWSKVEDKVAYVAEPSQPKFKNDDQTWNLEAKYRYEQTWGEKFQKRSQTVLVVLEFTGEVKVLNTLDKSASQVIFGPNDQSLIFRTVYHDARKFGIVYCHNRPGNLWQVDLDGTNVKLLSEGVSNARSPRLSKDGTYVVYMSNPIGGGHFGCARLESFDFASSTGRTIVDMVQLQEDFPGLYNEGFNVDCWLDDINILITSQWRSNRAILSVNCSNGTVTKQVSDADRSWSSFSAFGGYVLAAKSQPNEVPQLVLGQWHNGNIIWNDLYKVKLPQTVTTALGGIDYKVVKYPQVNRWLEAIHIFPAGSDWLKLKWIVYPHGGPHGSVSTSFSIYMASFCSMGYGVALVNYTGSIGFGQSSIDQLLGNIGQFDIEDTHHVAKALGSSHITLYGGSHGGFVSGHLIGRYPDFYKGAILHNPVLNVGTNLVQSDIPDWSYLEAGVAYDHTQSKYPSPPPAVYAQLYSMSPVATSHHITKPLLFLIGCHDMRVPNYESLNWYHHLKSLKADVQCFMYPEDNHSLDSFEADWNNYNVILQFLQKL